MKLSLFSVQDHYPQRERNLTAFYQQTMADCVLADKLGFDTFFVAEHHFHEYGVFPNAAVFLAAAAQNTQRIRLGTADLAYLKDQPRLPLRPTILWLTLGQTVCATAVLVTLVGTVCRARRRRHAKE